MSNQGPRRKSQRACLLVSPVVGQYGRDSREVDANEWCDGLAVTGSGSQLDVIVINDCRGHGRDGDSDCLGLIWTQLDRGRVGGNGDRGWRA